MRIYITRHGRAVSLAPTDEARPLTSGGREEVRRLWAMLRDEGIRPSRLVTSPYQRARETASELAGVYGRLPVSESTLLVPEGDPALVLDWLVREKDPQGMVLVGHMPLAGLLTGLLSEGPGTRVPFETGAVAALDMDVAAAGGARLLWLRTPGEVPANGPR